MSSYILKGINDDFDTCSHCGRTGLKRVMWLAEISAEGDEIADPAPYGTTCGARALGLKERSKAKIENKVYQMLIEQLNAKSSAVLLESDFFHYAKAYLIPRDLVYAVSDGQMTIAEAQAERNRRQPILDWSNADRDWASVEKFARFL